MKKCDPYKTYGGVDPKAAPYKGQYGNGSKGGGGQTPVTGVQKKK